MVKFTAQQRRAIRRIGGAAVLLFLLSAIATTHIFAHHPVSVRWLGMGIPAALSLGLVAGALAWLLGFVTFSKALHTSGYKTPIKRGRDFVFIGAFLVLLIGIFPLAGGTQVGALATPAYATPIIADTVVAVCLFVLGGAACRRLATN